MEWIIYVTIFLTGIMFGSFFTLAVYRIPRKENIVYGRSHCTSCNHKLGFLDLVPILSYVFLGGRCRYCGEKIRIRYLLLEIFSGLVFLFIAITHGIEDIITLSFIYLFVAGMFIIAGIDKERLEISNGLCIYEGIIAISYFIYLFYFQKILYLDAIIGAIMIPFLFYIFDLLAMLWKKGESNVPIGYGDIKYLIVIGMMFGYKIQLLSIAISFFIALFGRLIHRYKEIPWGYYLSISTILLMIIEPYIKPILELI